MQITARSQGRNVVSHVAPNVLQQAFSIPFLFVRHASILEGFVCYWCEPDQEAQRSHILSPSPISSALTDRKPIKKQG